MEEYKRKHQRGHVQLGNTCLRVTMKMSVHQCNFPNALLIQYDFIYNFRMPRQVMLSVHLLGKF